MQQLAATVKPVLGAVCASLFLAPTLTEHQGLTLTLNLPLTRCASLFLGAISLSATAGDTASESTRRRKEKEG